MAIDATANRINSAGYGYGANSNMTQFTWMTMAYDVAIRMVSPKHSSAGNEIYGYNHADQRVFVRDGNTVTDYLYGMGGERLMEFQEACTSYTESQRWIYFAGRKMFSKTGSTLKAVTPNRLASEAKHYPYGETQGTPPADTKDYFATYRRDGTGLDYAMNRYYSPTMGRFTTADPYGGSVNPKNPQSWNRYSYVENNPANSTDPTGLILGLQGFQDTWTGGWGDSMRDFMQCLYTPWDSHSSWGWLCGNGNQPYSEEMLSILGPYSFVPQEHAPGGTPVVLSTRFPGSLLENTSYNARFRKVFDAAMQGVLEKLASLNCGDALFGGSQGAISAIERTQWSFMTSIGNSYVGAATIQNAVDGDQQGIVRINASGPFVQRGTFQGPSQGGRSNTRSGSTFHAFNLMGLTQNEFRKAIILHELGHLLKIFGKDSANTSLNQSHTQNVIDNCFNNSNNLGLN